MKMKKLYITLGLVLSIWGAAAQNEATKTADKLFQRYEYVSAAKEYLKLTDKGKADAYVFKQLGDCYYNVFNSVEAEKWYGQAIATPQDAETYFRYAQMLKANKKYDEAKAAMQKFAAMAPNDSRASEANESSNYVTNLLGKAKLFDVTTLDINSKNSDFGGYLKDNTIYFASARNTASRSYGWNDQPKLDLYKVDYADGKVSGKPLEITDLNSKFHEGPLVFSPDGNTVYFSRESFFEKDFVKSSDKKIKMGKMYIFKAILNNGKWTDISPLPFNDKTFNTSSPSISKDGQTMYFVSDRPGGKGGNDIWKVAVNADGTFGTPEDLGNEVNTEGSEQFPFIADDNTLYFSSNGKKGLGGLDVFAYDMTKGTTMNLGTPLNSEKDDFAFTFNQAKNTAFVSSNRDGGTGDDDIYLATPVCGVDLVVTAHNSKTGDILPETSVSVLDDKNNVVGTAVTNERGTANFHLECDKDYMITADHSGFETGGFALAKSKGSAALNADLKPTEAIVTETEVILNEIRFEFNKSNITQAGAAELDKLVDVMNKYPNMVIYVKAHTDSRGNDKYNMSLSDRRAKSTVQYVISKGIAAERISGVGVGESEPKVDCGNNCTEEQHAENRRSEFLITKK